MDTNQKNRLDKSKDISLVDFLNGTNYEFSVKCSTSDYTYTITIDKAAKTINCTCLDMKTWCKRNNSICKHCCHVLLTVLPFNFRKKDAKLTCYNPKQKMDSAFFTTHIFTDQEMMFIKNTLKWRYPNEFNYCDKINNCLKMNLSGIAVGLFGVCSFIAGAYYKK